MHFENVLRKILILLWIYSVCENEVFAEPQLGDPYRILGVPRKASLQEIRQAYIKLVKKWFVFVFDSRNIDFQRIRLFQNNNVHRYSSDICIFIIFSGIRIKAMIH